MPDHAGWEISGLKVAEISSRKGAERAATKAARRPRGRAGSAAGLDNGRDSLQVRRQSADDRSAKPFAKRTAMSTYENEIRQALKTEIDSGRLGEVGAAHDVVELLTKNYAMSGSKIDWKRVPGSIEYYEEDRSQERMRFVEFFDEMCARFGLNGLVLYIGDGLTGFALAASTVDMRQALPVRRPTASLLHRSKCLVVHVHDHGR
jgi:hypothetical protein